MELEQLLGAALAALILAGLGWLKAKTAKLTASIEDADTRRAADAARTATFTAVDYLLPVALKAKDLGIALGLGGKLAPETAGELRSYARAQALTAAGAFATALTGEIDDWITERVEQRKDDMAAMAAVQEHAKAGDMKAMLLAATKVGRKP